MTYPLIEIKTIPIELEIKATHAKLEYTRGTADMEVSRSDGGLSIKSSPIRVNLDTFEARNSIVPTLDRSIRQSAQAGREAAYEATAVYARQGKLLLDIKVGQELVTQFAAEAQTKNLKTNVGIQFLPKTGAEISWDKGDMSIRYDIEKLNFDWKTGKGDFKFIPGDIEFSMTQRPDVIIRYVGGPIYVPPSADPDFESSVLDVEA